MNQSADRPPDAISTEDASTPSTAQAGVSAEADALRVIRSWPDLPPPAAEALQIMLAGNARFRAGHPRHPHESLSRRHEVAAGQKPMAAFYGCIDSRVPDEMVLDQGLGDLLTVRTAAHVLDDAALGSLEFCVHQLRVPLIMVVGHERCGAVTAAIRVLEGGVQVPSAIRRLVEALRPALEATRSIDDAAARLDAAVRWHTRLTVSTLLDRSPVLKDGVEAGEVGIVAARYGLETGEITPA
jgi:carbonic anhydrase